MGRDNLALCEAFLLLIVGSGWDTVGLYQYFWHISGCKTLGLLDLLLVWGVYLGFILTFLMA